MRLLCSSQDQNTTQRFSRFLHAQGIDNEVEESRVSDWGSSDYGTINYKIWITDEDQAAKAYTLYDEFLINPENARYALKAPSPPPPPLSTNFSSRTKLLQAPIPFITRGLLLLCSILFIWGTFSSPEYQSSKLSTTITPIYSSPLKKALLYDYPKAYGILAELVDQYGIDAIQDPTQLPPAGQKRFEEFMEHPYWQGYYEEILEYFYPPTKKIPPAWFEKIQQGELWRLITPIFLHGDIFHLLFNMIWLYILGKQLEMHLKVFRYLVFILITAIVTNTAQYLMGGPNFIGFSGVLCAMLTYIWRRQAEAPWEGYQLQRSTFLFIMLFIFGMFGLQTMAFFIEIATSVNIATSIANTAHISGAILGILLSKIPFFTQWNNP